MQIALAPMEGLVDEILRDVLTRVGSIDWCVTEFIRVCDRLLPETAYHKLAPELAEGALTRAGTPMRVQLLGVLAEVMAATTSGSRAVTRSTPRGVSASSRSRPLQPGAASCSRTPTWMCWSCCLMVCRWPTTNLCARKWKPSSAVAGMPDWKLAPACAP